MTESAATSVVIPVYNGERYLADAIRSVLTQTRAPDEVIVVDDGSTDGSAAVAASLGVTVLAGDHAGHATAMNRSIAAARGETVAVLDADDLWPPERTELLLAALSRNPDAGAAFGLTDEFVSPELTGEDRARLRAPHTGVRSPLHTAGLFRRSALDTIGPWNEHTVLGSGLDWGSRLLRSGVRRVEIEAVVLLRRLHPDSMGTRLATERAEYARVLKHHLDEMRQHRTPPS